MPTIVGILMLMCRINFMLNLAEHEQSFITFGPVTILKEFRNICQKCWPGFKKAYHSFEQDYGWGHSISQM